MANDEFGLNSSNNETQPTWGDYGSAAAAGAHDLQASLAAGARWASEMLGDTTGAKVFGAEEEAAGHAARANTLSMSDEGRKRLEESLLSKDFLSHPLSSIALKGTNMAPALAAQIASGLDQQFGDQVARLGGANVEHRHGRKLLAAVAVARDRCIIDREKTKRLDVENPHGKRI